MKKKDKIFALSKLLLPLGANKLIFWYFQPAATVKTKIKVFIKNIDCSTIDIAISNINRT